MPEHPLMRVVTAVKIPSRAARSCNNYKSSIFIQGDMIGTRPVIFGKSSPVPMESELRSNPMSFGLPG